MIDTHAHLNDEKLFARLFDVIKSAEEVGVTKIVCASYDLSSSELAIKIAKENKNVFATVGVHPHEAKDFIDDNQIELKLKSVCQEKKVIAYGEIGLDFYYDHCDRKSQEEAFVRQILLADNLKLPIVIHSREAEKQTLEILQNQKQFLNHGGILHCFSGDYEFAKKILDLGFILSFNGTLTFKKNENLFDVLKKIPKDSFVLETDCPYLAPIPYRGKINEPKFIVEVATKVSQILNISYREVELLTDETVKKVLKI